MNINYLQQWVTENKNIGLYFLDIKKFEDQYCIFFNKSNLKLQLNMNSGNSFPFFTKKNELKFEHTNELKNWSKLLAKSKLTNIEMMKNDRILSLTFCKKGIFNELVAYVLIIEFIPRYENIIIAELTEGKIIDCIKKISYMENRTRQILPGIVYEPPVTDFVVSEEIIKYPINYDEKGKIIRNDDGFLNCNECFESLYYDYTINRKINSIKKTRLKSIKSSLKRKKRKLDKLNAELLDSSKAELMKQKAELAKANYHLLKPGVESIFVNNYYQEGYPEIKIKLKSDLSPQKNIDFLFKKYRKAKNAKKHLIKQIAITKEEIEEFESKVFEVEHIDSYKEIVQLAEEKKPTIKKKQKRYKKLRINDDWEIFIGRTSTENDFLTTRFAKPYDWWFHTRVFRGTHIILRNYQKKEINEKLINLCCRLAAYFSKAKNSSNVPVDYTEIRYVRKPHGAAPGFVIYKNQQTLFCNPISMREAAKIIEKNFI